MPAEEHRACRASMRETGRGACEELEQWCGWVTETKEDEGESSSGFSALAWEVREGTGRVLRGRVGSEGWSLCVHVFEIVT